MDGTSANASPATADKSSERNAGAYVLVCATLLLAIMETVDALRGHPEPWSRRAILIALLGASMLRFIHNRTMQRVVLIVSVLFALDGIYALLNHG